MADATRRQTAILALCITGWLATGLGWALSALPRPAQADPAANASVEHRLAALEKEASLRRRGTTTAAFSGITAQYVSVLDSDGQESILVSGGAADGSEPPSIEMFDRQTRAPRLSLTLARDGDPKIVLYRKKYEGETKPTPSLELEHSMPFSVFSMYDRRGRRQVLFKVDGEGFRQVWGNIPGAPRRESH